MTSVSQIIPTYSTGGISDQPDELKKPGQLRDCVNAFPDVVKGLYKRPGLENVGRLQSLCEQGINKLGSWFHFSRENVVNPDSSDYVGHVSQSGQVNVWRCSDGQAMKVYYTEQQIEPDDNEGLTEDDLQQCNFNSYLQHTTDGALRFTTVNNYTFITNPGVGVTMSKVDNQRPYEAFIEITQLAYSREYLVDIDLVNTDIDSFYRTASEISLSSTANFGGDNKDDSCPANFRQVVTLNAQEGPGTGLVVEIESIGVQTPKNNGKSYECTYRHNVSLINGGRDFREGDICKYTNDAIDPETNYYIEITNTDPIYSSADYQVTGVLTPSNGDEVATIKSVLSDLRSKISEQTPILSSDIEIVGNGLYVKYSEPFTVTTSEKDLMNILSNTDNELVNPYCIVNNVSRLPLECKNGLVALVANSFSEEDDYWVQFVANYGAVTNDTQPDFKETAATGYWEEIAEPGGEVKFNSATMPQALVYSTINAEPVFVVAPVAWKKRSCGDESFNPSFNKFNITNLLFYRNRLTALSQENVIMTKAGELFNWFPSSAIAMSPADPIDISAATDYSGILQDGLVGNNTLVLFSQQQQFQLTTDSDILGPNTAKILEISRYNYSAITKPFNIGTDAGFISDRGGRAKVYELSNVFREGSVTLQEKSKIVSESFHKNVTSVAASPEDELLVFSNYDTTVWIYKFLQEGDKLIQDAWVKWEVPYKVISNFIINNVYYAVLENQIIDGDDEVYLTRLDLEQSITQGPFKDMWEEDDDTVGVPFQMKVEFPTVNIIKSELGQYRSDTSSSLVVHRLNFNFGDIGTYNFEIKRLGYDDYDVLYESRYMDDYKADATPVVPEVERAIPVYTKNTALDVSLVSNYEQPLILHSLRWEGDYNPKYYKRV